MHRNIILTVALACALATGAAAQKQTISVIEVGSIQNATMGDPVAVEKGFFGTLQVRVMGGRGLSSIDRVVARARAGEIVFGVDYPNNILAAREKRKLPVVVIAHDFQKSAVSLLSWDPLKSAREVKGTVGTWVGYDTQIKAMIGAGWEKQIKIVNQQGDPATLGGWLNKQYQFAHAMGYNEVLFVKHVVKEKYYVYSYADDFGMKWPENVVFTTEDIVRKYPQIVQQFVTGHYKGVQYALQNRAEAADILLKYDKNLDKTHEIEGMEFLASIILTLAAQQNGLGYIDPASWDQLSHDLVAARLFTVAPTVTAAYTTQFRSGVK